MIKAFRRRKMLKVLKLNNSISTAINRAKHSTMEYINSLDLSYGEIMAADYAVKIFTIYLVYELSKIKELVE